MRTGLAAPVLLALALAPRAAPAAGALSLAPCVLEHPLQLTVVPAECGTLEVAENPHAPRARHIALFVARVPAISRRKLPDPLVVLAGGPGQAATAFYAAAAGAFARIHRERDILLIDQRGTGRSNALDCGADRDLLYNAAQAQILADTRACLAQVSAHADVAWYTTSVAVADLERVRAALGYARLNLYGTSYGTRVAQHYLRRFPQAVRSVILDGVLAPQLAAGGASALDAEAALARILARCAAQAPCRARFGDPARAYRAVRASLGRAAVPVALADPESGAPLRWDFTALHLASVLRLASYSAESAALLPLLLDAAAAREDYAPLGAQFLISERAYAQALASGMHNSVVCTEDVPFYAQDASERARLGATFLGTLQRDGLEALCRVWPRGLIDPDLHAPLASAVPALLLSGSDDPVTPPAYAQLAGALLPHARQLLLAGFGHGQLSVPCVQRLMAEFIERADAASLDTACVREAQPEPFFLSLNGPAP
jgi:pimeloyl-ACP methyl ester carboxylesterase